MIARSTLSIGERIWDTYLLAVSFLAVELWVVALLSRSELASFSEALLAQQALFPVGALMVAPIALLAGIAVECLARSARLLPRASLAALCALFGGAVGWGVSTGRHLAGARRPLFALALAVIGGAVVYAVAPAVPRLLGGLSRARRRALVVLAAALAVALFELVNARVLPRLYPAFHVALSALTVAGVATLTLAYGSLGHAAPHATGSRLPATGRALVALAIFAGSAALLPSASERLKLADNIRIVYLEHAPVLGHVVELSTRLDPPPPSEGPAPTVEASSSGSFDLAGWDVLLISVDALRADHLGAYGYDRPVSPNIDALAAEGVVFEAAYTATPHTSYAVTSLMTGKFTRPLLAMDLGADSETWADHLRRYEFKTAAFYPPAVFFIDEAKFSSFSEDNLGFEYARAEFLPAEQRAAQVAHYLDSQAGSPRVFLWVHLFEPHEPYESHEGFDFGSRDVDRYDAEIAHSDRAIAEIVQQVRSRRPKTMVIVTADHGEEFGDHGGRYHGTTVYEEQVRVPLVVSAPGLLTPRRVAQPVQLVDLLPTVLGGLRVPRPARVRGRDLGDLLTGVLADDPAQGSAFAESEDMALLATGTRRLVCLRRASACSLYDLATDPRQRRDMAAMQPTDLSSMKSDLRAIEASHGRYEREGRVREGRGLPEALRRGMAGDGEAAPEIAALLDDAEVAIRRKSAETLFELRRKEVAPALRLALTREGDAEAKAYLALALVRLGEGAPHAFELLASRDAPMRRLAALALAEAGDGRGEDELVAWWRGAFPRRGRASPDAALSFERAKQVLDALASLRSKPAVGAFLEALDDVRLRPFVARALAKIGEDAARPALAEWLLKEPYMTSRTAITESLLQLGAGPELREPLVSMLGMPDPLPDGLLYAMRADLLKFIGGPGRDAELGRMRRFATSGVLIDFVVPELTKGAEAPTTGPRVRLIRRARAPAGGEIRAGARGDVPLRSEKKAPIPRSRPELDAKRAVTLTIAAGEADVEVHTELPPELGARPGKQASLVFYVTQGVELQACAILPLRTELKKPKP